VVLDVAGSIPVIHSSPDFSDGPNCFGRDGYVPANSSVARGFAGPRCPAGVLNLSKPAGVTSRDVVDRVQRLVRPVKAGHAGTLDPLATGVLVVCTGAATRLVPFVQAGRKQYRATFRLGCTSDTDDVTGEVMPGGDPSALSQTDLDAALRNFVGPISQVPPQVSAVHVGGERAYRRARRGETMEIAPRIVTVDAIELLDYTSPELTVAITCSAGTYVRAIGRDLGQQLGCGALMTALERTAVGTFRIEDALPADDLDETTLRRHLQPPGVAVAGLPRVELTDAQVRAIRFGQTVPLQDDTALSADIERALFDAAGNLVAVAHSTAGVLKPVIVLPTE
jgi:tRNA pseudouridine55 synthase